MTAVHISVRRIIACPVADVFAVVQDSEALGRAAGLPMTLIVEGADTNGPGAIRRVGPPVIGVEETILEVVPNERVRYRISRNGGPIRNYVGQMLTTAKGQGTELTWVMDFEVPWPLATPLRLVLPRVANLALKRLASRVSAESVMASAASV